LDKDSFKTITGLLLPVEAKILNILRALKEKWAKTVAKQGRNKGYL